MKETLRHQQAFEYYFGLGEKRSLLKVARKFTVSKQSAVKWSRAFNWQQRVEQRDIEVARKMVDKSKKLAERAEATLQDIKANYRKEVDDLRKVLRAAIATAARRLKDEVFEVKTAGELSQLVSADEKLVKLNLLLVGEATEKEEHTLIPLNPGMSPEIKEAIDLMERRIMEKHLPVLKQKKNKKENRGKK